MPDRGFRPAVPLGTNLPVQLRGVVAALGPSPGQILQITIDPGLSFRWGRAFWASLSPEQHPDDAPVHPQLPRVRLDAGPLSVKRPYLLVPGAPPLVPKLDLGRALDVRDARAEFCGGACRIVDSADRLAQTGVLGVEKSLDRRCHIRGQMPAI